MKLQISKDVAERIALKLPQGLSVDDLRIVTAQAHLLPSAPLDSAEQALVASQVETAGGPPLMTDGLPTVMRVVAWLTHEGMNKNRQVFRADDFGPAADKIREPNFLPMDWNHSAVLGFSFDSKAIGLWYRAEKRWDPKAKDGQGAYGILAQGIVWSWAFPQYANDMLAEQERNGHLDFSMACIPASVEMGRDDTGAFEILHNPTFLTLSALDVPPADPDAIGVGKEGSQDPNLEQQLTTELVGATVDLTAPPAAAAAAAVAAHGALTEEQMDELKKEIEALRAQLEAANTATATVATLQEQIAAANAELEKVKASLTEAETKNEALVAKATELTGAADALKLELDAATAKLAAIEAAKQEEAAKARYIARVAELPEVYRAKLEKRSEEERTRFEKKWTDASDEAWTEFKSEIEFTLAGVQLSYLQLSQKEGGVLPNGTSADAGDVASIVASIKK